MKKRLLILILILSPASLISAHPHITVNAYAHYYFNDRGMTGFYVQWIYDPVFSSQIIYECDVDMNCEFSPEENSQVKDYFFNRLASDGYYLELELENRRIPVPEPLNFTAEIDPEDEVVIFTFYIPLEEQFKDSGTRLKTGFSDPTSYTAFICPQRALSLQGPAPEVTNIKINRMGSIAFSY